MSLRTVVTGLALTHPPDVLAFVLVDFKGGAAFAGLQELPHVAGLITNLANDLAMVDRMHAALFGEIRRRQRCCARPAIWLRCGIITAASPRAKNSRLFLTCW